MSERPTGHPSVATWLWPVTVAAVLVASSFRGGGLSGGGLGSVLLIVQFGGMALAGVILVLSKPQGGPRPRTRLDVAVLLWPLVSLLSLLWTSEWDATLTQSGIFFALGVLLILVRHRRWTSPRMLWRDVRFLYFTGVGIHLVGIIGYLRSVEWVVGEASGRFAGVFSNPNFTGIQASLLLTVGVVLMERSSLLAVIPCQLVLLGSLVQSGSRGALLAFVVGVGVVAMRRSASLVRRGFVAGVFFLMVAVVWGADFVFSALGSYSRDTDADFSSGRLQIWSDAIEVWKEHPLVGIGFYAFQSQDANAGFAVHNTYLSVLVETGLLGAVMVAAAAWGFATCVEGSRAFAGPAVAVLVSELTESSITGFGNSVALLSWLLIVAATVRTDEPNSAAGTLPRASADPQHATVTSASDSPSPARVLRRQATIAATDRASGPPR